MNDETTGMMDAEGDDFVEDPLEALESKLRDSQIEQAKRDLAPLVDALTRENAPRLLRIIEQFAEHHRELLACLALGEDNMHRKRKGGGISLDPLTLYESGESGETFGAQAVQQLGTSLGSAVAKANGAEGREVRELVDALATAKEASLDGMVPLIEGKLNKLLGKSNGAPQLPEHEEAEAEPEVVADAEAEVKEAS